MKKLLVLLFLLPLLAVGQVYTVNGVIVDDFDLMDNHHYTNSHLPCDPPTKLGNSSVYKDIFDYWSEYLKDCNTLVADTIVVTGYVNTKYKQVKDQVYIQVTDTVWEKPVKKKYLIDSYSIGRLSFGSGNFMYRDDMISDTPKITIKKNFIYKIPKCKANWYDFWERWMVEKKYINMN